MYEIAMGFVSYLLTTTIFKISFETVNSLFGNDNLLVINCPSKHSMTSSFSFGKYSKSPIVFKFVSK